ncbi:formylglycine-generating enzyme family protein [Rivularia sp. UHCC 0363]|uniref:formylglycine-generating enzyme family protein n=1 Tax=Rivularia sp. UHCC 0363 TaxID=3110244 RepID=UPI002B2116EF|nr:formylglycine-generating enzyme family protein [Rivularia sp. UHCC 0363]MEA5597381.1 formylglycine-generating enzyme family protein [Rivularia sp. UHCC 0363]
MANLDLHVDELPGWLDVDPATELKLPVVTLEPKPLQRWASVIAGRRQAKTAGVVLDDVLIATQLEEDADAAPLSAEERVNRFWATASFSARRLAGMMAATQVSLPIVHLIQRELMPQEASPVHVAEVFMSGLLYPVGADASDTVRYEFYKGVRDYLVDATRKSDTEAVLEEVILKRLSKFIEERTGVAIRSFEAFLAFESAWDSAIQQEIAPFAQITRQVLRRLGGAYAALADQTVQPPSVPSGMEPVAFPPLQEFEFETALLEIEETELLEPFEFEVATVTIQRQGGRQPKVVIQKERRQTSGYVESLSEAVSLEMVAIPAGRFLMGSPNDEPERRDSESPQHEVTVSTFFMSKYPVTQAQWNVVAGLPQVERELEIDPSSFKGADRPVEKVSWLDASEFCARLSQLTGKEYRLPTEAEWEYACRAGTTTPFHFGETITPDLANSNWYPTYNKIRVTKEKDFEGTTPVGQFAVANAFGLYDMHGNVWEWCVDQWYSNYEGAPTDGSAWIGETPSEQAYYVLRGGSWNIDPRNCRSAARDRYDARFRALNFGFRVVCSASVRD